MFLYLVCTGMIEPENMKHLKTISDPEAFKLMADETRRKIVFLLRAIVVLPNFTLGICPGEKPGHDKNP